eukprot:468638_1
MTRALLLSFICSLCSATPRYFVDHYNEYLHHYPINTCNSIGLNFVLYECQTTSSNEQSVTKYNNSINYPNCDDPTSIVTNYTIHIDSNRTTSFLSTSLYSFNCVGEDDFIEYIFYSDNACDEYDINANHSDLDLYVDYISSNYVTGICYSSGDMYWYISCNGFFSTELYFNSLSECLTGTNAVITDYYPSRQCKENWRLNKCVSNGTILTPYSYLVEEKTFPIPQRITLIDLFFNLHLHKSVYYTINCIIDPSISETHSFIPWNITQIAIAGTSFTSLGDDYCLLTTEYVWNETEQITYLTVTEITLLNMDSHPLAPGLFHSATIQDSICYLHDLNYLRLGSYDYDDITNTIFGGINISHESPVLSGSIPGYNQFMTGPIPDCVGNLNISTLWIEEMHGLIGFIPENIFCSYYLYDLKVMNNTGLNDQQIPNCFSNDKHDFFSLLLQHSHFVGTVPALPISVRFMPLQYGLWYIGLNDNNFEGSLSDLFESYLKYDGSMWSAVQFILLQNNNFYEENIGHLLKSLFTGKSDPTIALTLNQLSIANNARISGTIPDMDIIVQFKQRERSLISAFLAHNCDLHGTIPESIHF